MMMNSSEFQTLIERNVGTIYFEDTISKNRFSQLRLFLEKEIGVKVPDQWSSSMTYVDLWQKVNTLTEAPQSSKNKKRTKMKSKEPEKEEKSSEVVVSSKNSNGLAINNKIAKKISDISSQIEDDKGQLKYYLKKIKNTKSNIEIGSYIGFVPKKDDIVKSISEVYSTFRDYILTCGNAIRSTNGNITNILELIKLLATAEADIYKLIDDQSLASNELRVLIKDWCKEHGIHDEEVDKLLESSFQRAYTLRDRLNNLREEIYNKLDNYKETIDNILEELPNYQAKIQESTDNALAIIEESKEKNINDIDHHYTEKEQELQAKYELLTSNANKLIENIAVIKKTLDENEAEFVKKVASHFEIIAEKERLLNQHSEEIKDHFLAVAKELSDKGTALEEMSNKALENLDRKRIEDYELIHNDQSRFIEQSKEQIIQNLTDLKHKHQASLESLEKDSQTFQAQILDHIDKTSEARDKEFKVLKESQEWFKKELNKNLDEKIQEFADLHKQFVTDQTTITNKLEHQVTTYKIVAVIAGIVSVASIVIGLLV